MSFRPKPLLGKRLNTAHSLAKGLKCCWVTNEGGGSNLYDLSNNNNMGFFQGSPYWATRKVGGVVGFNKTNSDYINSSFIPNANRGTFAIRVNMHSSANNESVVSAYSGSGQQLTLMCYLGSWNWWGIDFDINTPAVELNKWLTIVATYDDRVGAFLYIDKELVGSDTSISTQIPGPVYLAKLDSASEVFADFEIEYCYLYNRALSFSEVQVLHINPYDMFEDPYPIELFSYVEGLNLEQEGFRFRDDDDSESAAAWLALQDVDITRAKLTNTRLRILLNATGDQASKQFKLQYKKTSDSIWRDMPES